MRAVDFLVRGSVMYMSHFVNGFYLANGTYPVGCLCSSTAMKFVLTLRR